MLDLKNNTVVRINKMPYLGEEGYIIGVVKGFASLPMAVVGRGVIVQPTNQQMNVEIGVATGNFIPVDCGVFYECHMEVVYA